MYIKDNIVTENDKLTIYNSSNNLEIIWFLCHFDQPKIPASVYTGDIDKMIKVSENSIETIAHRDREIFMLDFKKRKF